MWVGGSKIRRSVCHPGVHAPLPTHPSALCTPGGARACSPHCPLPRCVCVRAHACVPTPPSAVATDEWRSQLLEVAPLFRVKYASTWFPTTLRLTLGTLGSTTPSEAWVDDIMLLTRTVPECPGLTATATPGSTYLASVLGSAPPDFMWTLDQAAGAGTVVNHVDGMFFPANGLTGAVRAGVTLGAPGLVGDNRTAALVNTGVGGAIAFPATRKVQGWRLRMHMCVFSAQERACPWPCVRACVCALVGGATLCVSAVFCAFHVKERSRVRECRGIGVPRTKAGCVCESAAQVCYCACACFCVV